MKRSKSPGKLGDQELKWYCHAGVKELTTVEYQEIVSEHPQLSTMTPKMLAESFLSDSLPTFDFAVSFSSYEHDGLGR